MLPPEYCGEASVTLSDRDYHYLCRVRRFREGDVFSGCDRRGTEYELEIRSILRNGCVLNVRKTEAPAVTGPYVTLFQCLPKARKLDQIVRQVTEAGVSRIVPVESEYCIARIESGDEEQKKLERWNRVAREALQQSGTARLPEILPPVRLSDIPSLVAEDELGLFFHQEVLEGVSLHRYLSAWPQRIAYVIGPEGGLSGKETELLKGANFKPVFLGENVLRTETAALYALASIKLLFLEKDEWNMR